MKRLSVKLIAMLVLTAVFASGAHAAASTPDMSMIASSPATLTRGDTSVVSSPSLESGPGAREGMTRNVGIQSDAYPCVRSTRYPSLPYACPVWWPADGRIPVFGQNNVIIDYLYPWSGTQYFACEAVGTRWYVGNYYNIWYAKTQGDGGKWGWVSEVYFKGGGNDQPDAGLPWC